MSDELDQTPRLHYMDHYDSGLEALNRGEFTLAIAHALLGLVRLFQIPEERRT
jgi:hypothetical protein